MYYLLFKWKNTLTQSFAQGHKAKHVLKKKLADRFDRQKMGKLDANSNSLTTKPECPSPL